MKVYAMRNDVNKYQYFLKERDEDAFAFYMDGTPRAASWSPPPVYIYEPKHKIGDLYNFGAAAPIFSPHATEILRPLLEESGELLPLPHAGTVYTVLNVLTIHDCLDEAHSGERLGGYKPLAFYPDKLAMTPSAFFKFPQDLTTEYVVEGLRSPEQEVRHLVSTAGLRGIEFDEVWSDQG